MQKQVVVSTRLPKAVAVEMKEIVKENFLNEADFVRTAIRDEILKYKIAKIRKAFDKHGDSVKAVRELRKLTNQLNDEGYERWVEERTKKMP